MAANVCEIVCRIGLCGLRNLLQSKDAYTANKYIIQLLKYCKDDLSQHSNIIIDSSVEGILASLAIGRNDAKSIYVNSQITSLDQLPYVKFGKEGNEALGYLLYFMERSFGNDCQNHRKLLEIFEFLNLSPQIIKKYEAHYIGDIVQKTNEQQVARYVLENVRPVRQELDYRSIRKSCRKMERFYPAGVDNLGKKVLAATNRAFDLFMENDEDAASNMIAESAGMIFDGRKDKKIQLDDVMEDIQKDLYEVTGMGGNDFYRNKIKEKTQDQVTIVHS